ncbi:cytochrome c [Hyphomicrobium sp.]|uniref:c-type cytochrome n=1 Tax=Hyphomicrobium sp. TaxID=82 RepID=UPI0025C53DF8|nr:cytochrome c [Hyphomicrobium sp.]MCC7251942.1 cytochrome c [Hyphomicrobium sp.]
MNATTIKIASALCFLFMAVTVMAGGFPPPIEDPFSQPSSETEGTTSDDTTTGKSPPEEKSNNLAEQEESSDIPINLNDAARIEAGKERFHSTCADFCHGHEPALFIGRPVEPHHAFETIRDGGKGATPMPPWGDVFSEEEIWELVAYLNHLGKAPGQ